MHNFRSASFRLKLAAVCLLAPFALAAPAWADQPMKTIVLINPNSNTKATDSMADLARNETKGVANVVGKSNRVTPGDPMELVKSPAKLGAALAKAVKESIEKDGANAVIMGGGPLSASALRLQPQFDVPLIVAVNAAARAAVKAIEAKK